MKSRIALAAKEREIQSCYPVMVELRAQLQPEEFLQRVKNQAAIAGYRLAYLLDGEVKAVAGFRISESLAWGKYLYVDDFVAKSDARSKGYGTALFNWLVEYARAENCDQLHLDSAVHRFAAHRFYLNKRMAIEGHHFGLTLIR